MRRALVVVDPGHGGADPGAVNGNVEEAELNLDLALEFMLEARSSFDVILTRKVDKEVSLAARVAIANAQEADAFLSFHCNAAENKNAHGFEVWTTPGETAADALATSIFKALGKAFPLMYGRQDTDDGDPDKEKNFYVLRNTKAPAVLIEFGFLSNDEEAAFLCDALNQFVMVEAVISAVKEWLKATP